MLEAVDRTDPMEFEDKAIPVNELPSTIGSEEMDQLIAVFNEYGIDDQRWISRQLKGLASGMGLPNGNIRKLQRDQFDTAVSLLRKGLDKWVESTSSEASDSGPDASTAQRGAA
jgi:hypothetical protein